MNRNISKSFSDKLENLAVEVSETSYLGLRPGNIIQITYAGSLRYGLVVSSKRTSNGIFLSPRNNTLLNIVLIDSLSDAMFSLMVNNLYNNESACNYNSPAIIGAFLGKQNFRTFNVSKIRNVLKVTIK
jgi:hypothetical protein|tara:strand:+ start:77 stop:463 length:387 start_codon:yes stop_codon:yes gene_type:complete